MKSLFLFRYQDIQAGLIPSSVAAHLKAVIREANSTQKEIENIESKNEAKGLDFEMDQKDVAHLFKLHKQLEKLKAQFELLRNPVLRFALAYLVLSEQRERNCLSALWLTKICIWQSY